MLVDDNEPPRKRGKSRMRELAAEAAAENESLKADLIAGLGREPNAIDRISIDTLVATVIRAARLRAQGKNDHEERKLVSQLIRATGLRPAPPSQPEQPGAFGLFVEDDDEVAR